MRYFSITVELVLWLLLRLEAEFLQQTLHRCDLAAKLLHRVDGRLYVLAVIIQLLAAQCVQNILVKLSSRNQNLRGQIHKRKHTCYQILLICRLQLEILHPLLHLFS